MYFTIRNRLRDSLAAFIHKTYGVELTVVLEKPPKLEMGEAACPVSFELAKRLKKIIDMLKPQQKVRVRYQEEGAELDLDVALRSLIDFKSGAQPDPRINMSHKHDGRSVEVSLLVDLSASLNDVPEGCTQTKLELSQEAVEGR